MSFFADMKKTEIKKSKADKNAEPKKTPTWKKVLGGILTAIVVIALIFCVVVVVQAKRSNKPFLFGYATYYVVSGSMEPTIKVGEVILIQKVDNPMELKRDDIITFHGRGGNLEGKVVTHRIVSDGVEDGKITTCGDANYGIKDTPITYEDVIGKYVKTSAFLTGVYSLFSNKYGFLFIVFIPLMILLVVQIVNFRRACKMDKDGKMPEEKSAEEIKEQAVKDKEAEIKRKAIEEYLASKKRIDKVSKDKKSEKK